MATKAGKAYADPRSSPEFKALMKRMKRVPIEFEGKITRGAVRASASVYVQAAKKNIKSMPAHGEIGPRKPGSISYKARDLLLESVRTRSPKILVKKRVVSGGVSIKQKIIKKPKGGEKTEKDGAWWWPFIEFGTVQRSTSKGWNRGLVVAHPFMRPAFDTAGDRPIKAYKDYMAKRFDKDLQKHLDKAAKIPKRRR